MQKIPVRRQCRLKSGVPTSRALISAVRPASRTPEKRVTKTIRRIMTPITGLRPRTRPKATVAVTITMIMTITIRTTTTTTTSRPTRRSGPVTTRKIAGRTTATRDGTKTARRSSARGTRDTETIAEMSTQKARDTEGTRLVIRIAAPTRNARPDHRVSPVIRTTSRDPRDSRIRQSVAPEVSGRRRGGAGVAAASRGDLLEAVRDPKVTRSRIRARGSREDRVTAADTRRTRMSITSGTVTGTRRTSTLKIGRAIVTITAITIMKSIQKIIAAPGTGGRGEVGSRVIVAEAVRREAEGAHMAEAAPEDHRGEVSAAKKEHPEGLAAEVRGEESKRWLCDRDIVYCFYCRQGEQMHCRIII